MNHREKLIELYQLSTNSPTVNLPGVIKSDLELISDCCFTQKGVFTVILTLAIHKIIDSKQDIRYHQANMKNGFSGRTIDKDFITPTLKELRLPSMAESGWLTRSLEQPYPYDKHYNGKIGNKKVRGAFLNLVEYIQNNPKNVEDVTKCLLHFVRKKTAENEVKITPLKYPEKLNINDIIDLLEKHFSFHYRTHGGSKLPVLAFYAIFQSLINEVSRYKNCRLEKMGSHTASDLTSRSSGDIEIYDSENNLVEAIEIKHNKNIDITVVRVAVEKIYKFNPKRYCILSFANIKREDQEDILSEIKVVEKNHGCQIIVNGIMPTLKYYLRLINSLPEFIENYRTLVESDSELKQVHKEKLLHLLERIEVQHS